MNDILTISADEMRILLKPHRRPKGRFIARMETGEWVGADTRSRLKKLTGTFAEVIEWFIPYTGISLRQTERFEGIRASADGIVRIPYEALKDPDTKRAARFAVRRGSAGSAGFDLPEWDD